MVVDVNRDLEQRLKRAAESSGIAVAELVEQALGAYLDALRDQPSVWVRTTQHGLGNIWSTEDFTDWGPPSAR